MALFRPMTVRRAGSVYARQAILFALFIAVVTSGVPLVEVHQHEHAHVGHGHTLAGQDHARHDESHDRAAPADDAEQSDAMHAHSLSTPALSVIEMAASDPVCVMYPCNGHELRSRPPDIALAPLFRPPIV